MLQKKQPRSAALRYLHKELIGDDPARLESLEAERVNADIAQKIFDLRTQARLTQAELAKLAHTSLKLLTGCRANSRDLDGNRITTNEDIDYQFAQRRRVHFELGVVKPVADALVVLHQPVDPAQHCTQA